MRNNIFVLLFCSVLLLSCSVKKGGDEYHSYYDGITFKVLGIYKNKSTDGYNSNQTLIAAKGKRFASIALEFKNDTKENKIVDFEDFFLLDNKNNKYQVSKVVRSLRVAFTNKKMEFEIKPGVSKTFFIEFHPSFSKDEEITTLLVKNQVIKFK